jgi:hypothetical protein
MNRKKGLAKELLNSSTRYKNNNNKIGVLK